MHSTLNLTPCREICSTNSVIIINAMKSIYVHNFSLLICISNLEISLVSYIFFIDTYLNKLNHIVLAHISLWIWHPFLGMIIVSFLLMNWCVMVIVSFLLMNWFVNTIHFILFSHSAILPQDGSTVLSNQLISLPSFFSLSPEFLQEFDFKRNLGFENAPIYSLWILVNFQGCKNGRGSC